MPNSVISRVDGTGDMKVSIELEELLSREQEIAYEADDLIAPLKEQVVVRVA